MQNFFTQSLSDTNSCNVCVLMHRITRAEERDHENETRLTQVRQELKANAQAEARRLADRYREELEAAKAILQEDKDRFGSSSPSFL